MEIKVLEKSKTKFGFNLIGEGHALCSVLKKELWNDKNVSVSGYYIEHPSVGMPTFMVESKDNPIKALENAATRLKKKNSELLKAVKKQL
jgi:DNA-directed RNA polymerase subunit L